MKQHSVAGDDAQQSRIQENHLQGMAGIRNLKGDKFRYIPLGSSVVTLSIQTSLYSRVSEALVSKLRSAVQI